MVWEAFEVNCLGTPNSVTVSSWFPNRSLDLPNMFSMLQLINNSENSMSLFVPGSACSYQLISDSTQSHAYARTDDVRHLIAIARRHRDLYLVRPHASSSCCMWKCRTRFGSRILELWIYITLRKQQNSKHKCEPQPQYSNCYCKSNPISHAQHG